MRQMILKKVRRTIEEYGLLEKKDKILIAYSGGVDSTGLLHLLLELQREWSFKLYMGHFNHRLRRKAKDDEKFVKNIAWKYSLPLFVGSEDVRSYAVTRRLNLEEAGRTLRYEFLRKIADEIRADKIATGHTLNDQAETFLIRLLRGSGLRGLASIYPVVEGTIVRPLIQIERDEIEGFLKGKGIKFCMDESNFDRRFLRNRIRLELIPNIQKNFEPQLVSRLGRVASIMREEDGLLEKIIRKETQKVILKKDDQIFLDLKSLSSLPRAAARRAVRNFISELKGNLREITFEDVESILCLREGKEFPLRKDHILRREQDRIFVKKESLSKKKFEYEWKGRECLKIEELQMNFKGKKMKKDNFPHPDFDDQAAAFLDLSLLTFPLLVRNRREGDRYRPLGSPGQKKLKEIMRAKGVPISERGSRPVFLSGDEIVWVLGLPVSERFKVKKETRDIFVVEKL